MHTTLPAPTDKINSAGSVVPGVLRGLIILVAVVSLGHGLLD
ncbi:hypothetical protein [Jiangella aurantiaca]|nr:hypothetical protein [Jiangella aurantiaca]